jgi:hypothetical protein
MNTGKLLNDKRKIQLIMSDFYSEIADYISSGYRESKKYTLEEIVKKYSGLGFNKNEIEYCFNTAMSYGK